MLALPANVAAKQAQVPPDELPWHRADAETTTLALSPPAGDVSGHAGAGQEEAWLELLYVPIIPCCHSAHRDYGIRGQKLRQPLGFSNVFHEPVW